MRPRSQAGQSDPSIPYSPAVFQPSTINPNNLNSSDSASAGFFTNGNGQAHSGYNDNEEEDNEGGVEVLYDSNSTGSSRNGSSQGQPGQGQFTHPAPGRRSLTTNKDKTKSTGRSTSIHSSVEINPSSSMQQGQGQQQSQPPQNQIDFSFGSQPSTPTSGATALPSSSSSSTTHHRPASFSSSSTSKPLSGIQSTPLHSRAKSVGTQGLSGSSRKSDGLLQRFFVLSGLSKMMRESKSEKDHLPSSSGIIDPLRRASLSSNSGANGPGGAGLLGGGGKSGGVGLSAKKIALVVLALVGLMTVGKWVLPSGDPAAIGASHASHDHVLTPRDYLNASLADPAPFDFCPVFGPGDPVAERRGQWGLLKSRLHTGSNARMQRVIQKALSGMPVTMSVLGGSVSACHGAGDDPVAPKCYPSLFFEWWNSVFPHPASELTNGAARRTDSAYFAYCSAHHLPDQTDLVILEFDASDPNDPEWLQHFELLVRSILVRPDMPAVIILGHFSPQVQAQNGFAGPELLHTVVAQFYDVPHISTKGVLYHDYLTNPETARNAFYSDPVLANPAGHELLADVLISYTMSQICAGWSASMGHAFDVPYMGVGEDSTGSSAPTLLGGVGLRKGMPGQEPGDGESVSEWDSKMRTLRVPSARLSDRPSDILEFREIEPFCVSANDLINPLPPSLFYGSGWHAHHPSKGETHGDRHYWYAEQPSSRLRVPVKLGAGDVGVYYLQSPEDKPMGKALCWVDDNVAGAVELDGTANVPDTVPTLTIIDRHVSRGSHFVECQLMGIEGQQSPPFKILGILTT